MLICNTCGLHYEVIWNNDGDEPPTNYCPRCGEYEDLTTDEEEV
jgi:hypothetical protein